MNAPERLLINASHWINLSKDKNGLNKNSSSTDYDEEEQSEEYEQLVQKRAISDSNLSAGEALRLC
jgi:regulatory protein YycH of two-component signal transduction system YycFG